MILRIAALALLLLFDAAVTAEDLLEWGDLPPLPDSIGFAGPFAGVVEDRLVVAGGANFPAAPPWEQGKKSWYRSVFILDRESSNWRRTDDLLPRPLGYGGSVTIPSGLLCLGGSNEEGHFADVFLIQGVKDKLEIHSFPSLPRPVAHPAVALLGDTIYVAGGLEHQDATCPLAAFWKFDLRQVSSKRRWEELEPWPGPPRFLATAGAIDGAFYLFGGVDLAEDADGKTFRRYLKDAYQYVPHEGWQPITDLPYPLAASPGPAIPTGQSHLVLLGGDTGELALQVNQLRENHPGFDRRILAYHPITKTWAVRGNHPRRASVTTSAVLWHKQFVVPSGEVQPGVRTPSVVTARSSR